MRVLLKAIYIPFFCVNDSATVIVVIAEIQSKAGWRKRRCCDEDIKAAVNGSINLPRIEEFVKEQEQEHLCHPTTYSLKKVIHISIDLTQCIR